MAKPSRFSRLAQLGGLTGRMAGGYLGNKVKDAFRNSEMRQKARDRLNLDNAREIVETVGRMKGAAMKLGQQLAIAAEALDLSPEIAATLGQLNSQGEPIPFSQIKEDIEEELEGEICTLFARFDEVPLGTASLGQAHTAAMHDGSEVVVKVLHRGVEGSVDTDLLALKAVLLSARSIRRPKAEIDAIFDEIKARLKEELDYLQEAVNIHTFQQMFKGEDWIRIPAIHQKYCTERVLTMDRVPGTHIEHFAVEGSPEARQRAAESLAELYYRQAFGLRTLHADPHPGNFLFDEDGTIGLIDFGCIKRFDEFFIADYARCAQAIFADDRTAALKTAIDMGSWDGKNPAAGDVLWAYLQALGHGFRLGPIQLGIGHEHLHQAVIDTAKPLMRYPNLTLPSEILFLHRSLGGLYTLSRQLKGTVDYGAVAMRWFDVAVAQAEGR